ncbi:MAG: GNAT family N-acetyltransferase [Chloroflexi bacterium]|nr:GNAT family N-acetyltransferase [Chloroflexota bacterium]
MAGEISVVDPRTCPDWDVFVDSHPDATVFHTSGWARVLLGSYRYRPLYHVRRDESGAIQSGVALMQVDGRLTTRRLVGLPFSDVCPPLLEASNESAELISVVSSAAAKAGASHVELRGPGAVPLDSAGFSGGQAFYQHIIPIAASAEETAKGFHSSARRAIRKAEKEGLSVREAGSLDDMREFYRLTVLTRKKHGLLPQPWRFFANIHKQMIEAGAGHLLLADFEGRPIAGDLLLQFRDQMVYKFNASDPRFLNLRPNNILLWQAIRLSASLGCRSLDLGRCDTDNEGLRRFKLLWGSDEKTLRYYTHAVAGATNGSLASNALPQSLLALFVKLAPSSALRGMGSAIYHNFG